MPFDTNKERAKSADNNLTQQISFGLQSNYKPLDDFLRIQKIVSIKNQYRKLNSPKKKIQLFSGIEIKNIPISKTKLKDRSSNYSKRSSLKQEDDFTYHSVDYNSNKVLLDESIKFHKNHIVYRVGKLKTGSTCHRVKKKTENSREKGRSGFHSKFDYYKATKKQKEKPISADFLYGFQTLSIFGK